MRATAKVRDPKLTGTKVKLPYYDVRGTESRSYRFLLLHFTHSGVISLTACESMKRSGLRGFM